MRSLALLLLLGAALCCAHAAHAPSQAVKIAEDMIAKGGDKDAPAIVAFRYVVEPSKRKDFVSAWRKHEKPTAEEKGVIIFDLKFPFENNADFFGYGEWKSMRDYLEHYESDHTKDFLSQLNKLNVPWTIEVLEQPEDVGELRRPPSRGEEKDLAHVIIKYHVKPAAHKQFLDAWSEAEKGTESEKGAHIYSLRRIATTNTQYYAYGTWSNMKEYAAHFESDHVKQLLTTLNKHDIIYHLTPLVKVGDQPE